MEKYSLQFRDRSVQSVLQRGQTKFIQLSFEPGEGLKKHRAPLSLTVIVLDGQIQFSVGEKTEVLKATDMLTLDPNVEHAVEADLKSIVLLVLTPDNQSPMKPVLNLGDSLQHENAFLHPELIEQIAPELRSLVDDHVHLCEVLQSLDQSPNLENIQIALLAIGQELDNHFVAEEKVLFPRIANHVGGMDMGPVARLLEEHRHIRHLHEEAKELLVTYKQQEDEQTKSLLRNKVVELSKTLLNHLGKEDSHLFPMASRLLTPEEKKDIANELRAYEN